MGLLFIKLFVTRDAYATLRGAGDCRCDTKGPTMWALSTARLGILRAYINLISQPRARSPAGGLTGWGRAVDKQAVHYSAGGKVALALGPL